MDWLNKKENFVKFTKMGEEPAYPNQRLDFLVRIYMPYFLYVRRGIF